MAGVGLRGQAPNLTTAGHEAAGVSGTAWRRLAAPAYSLLGVLLVSIAVLRGEAGTRAPLLVRLAVNLATVAVAWAFTHELFGPPNLRITSSALDTARSLARGATAPSQISALRP